jgi:hypothetical protein
MQSHLGAIPPVAIVALTALALRVVRPPHESRLPSGKLALVTIGGVALLWTPPLIDQITAARGNISATIAYFGSSGLDPRVGWAKGVGMAATELVPWGPWISREHNGFIGDVLPSPAWTLSLCAVPLVAALALAVRFRDDLSLRLVAIATSGVLASVVSFAQIRGVAYYYLVLWSRPIAMLATIAPAVVLARKLERSRLGRFSWNAVAAAAGTAIVAVPIAVCALRARLPTPYWASVHAEVMRHAMAVMPSREPFRVVAIGPFYTGSAETLVVAFERAGRAAKMMPWYATAVGEHRTIPADAKVPTLVLATGIGVERVPHRETATLLFLRDNLAGEKRTAATALRRRLEDQLVAAGRRDLLDQLEASQPWLWALVPRGVDFDMLRSYIDLTMGDENMPIALFALPPTTW